MLTSRTAGKRPASTQKSTLRPKPGHPRLPFRWKPWMEYPLRFLAGLLLARCTLLKVYAPFGLGFVAASGSGWGGAAALAGAAVGWLTGLGIGGALRYLAAGVLTYSVAFAFFDVPVYRGSWFLSVTAVLAAGLTGVVYLSGGMLEGQKLLCFGAELLTVGVSCRCYQNLRTASRREQRAARLFLAVTLLCSLSGLHLPLLGSLSGVLGTAVVLAAARGGGGAGVVCGAGVGLALSASGGAGNGAAAALALAGLLAGADGLPVGGGGRLGRTLLGLGGGLSALLWIGGSWQDGVMLTAGAVCALLLPQRLLTVLDRYATGKEDAVSALSARPPQTPERLQETARFRLEEQSAAFRSLYERLRESMAQHPTGESTAVILQHTCRRVCTQCALYDTCWNREHLSTYEDLNAALAVLQERGRGEARDYPERFRQRCLRFEDFRTAANEELSAFWTRRTYRMRLRESRAAVGRQYLQLSRLLEEAAATLGQELHYDCGGTAAAERGLDRLGVRGEAALWLDGHGRRVLLVTGRDVEPLRTKAGLSELGAALGVPMELWDALPVRRGTRLTLRQCPPLSAAVGVAVRKREGQAVSGDSGSWFKDERGQLWVTVCDGMGSGAAANAESSLVLHLVEDFLHAGIEPEAALTTLTSALALRGEIDGGFTTVDLLQLDLYSGGGALFKLGGAPSYLRRRGSISRVSGVSLPAGLEGEGENCPDVTRFRLAAGDCVVLLSDGITDGTGDLWLRTVLERWDGESPRLLAEEILQHPRTRRTDDCTVAAVLIRNS